MSHTTNFEFDSHTPSWPITERQVVFESESALIPFGKRKLLPLKALEETRQSQRDSPNANRLHRRRVIMYMGDIMPQALPEISYTHKKSGGFVLKDLRLRIRHHVITSASLSPKVKT